MNASEGRSCGKGRMNAVSLLCGHLSAGGEMQAYTVLLHVQEPVAGRASKQASKQASGE